MASVAKENVADAWPPDLAAPKRPDSGDGPEERTLPRTRPSSQKNGVTTRDREIHIRDKRLTIGLTVCPAAGDYSATRHI